MSTERLPCGCIMSRNPLGVRTFQPCSPTCPNYLYVQEQIAERNTPTEVMLNPGCWSCGTENNDFMGIGETDPGVPEEGNVGICGYCAAVAIYTGQVLLTRKPTREELAEIMADPTIRKAVTAIQIRNATAGMGRS